MVKESAKRRDGETVRKPIRHFRDLDVYQNALATGLWVYELTKKLPVEERYALTDQVRRSSRSVCANIAEAWRKRRYEGAFIAKLAMRKVKQPKRKFIWNSRFAMDIYPKRSF